MTVEIRAFFNGWNRVSKEKAYNFIKGLLASAQNVDKSNDEEVNMVVVNHLKGITWEELKQEFEKEVK